MAALAQRAHALALEVAFRLRVDRLQRARLTELDVLPEVELDALEDVETAGGQMRLQVGLVAPADRIDLTGVDSGGAGGDLAALEQRDAPAERGEVVCHGGAGDAAAHHQDVRLGCQHDTGPVKT